MMDGYVRAGSEPKLLSVSILRGCNVYHTTSVIRLKIDLGELAGIHTGDAGPDFVDRIIERFGSLKTLEPAGGLPDIFLDRLKSPEEVPLVDVLFRAMLAVEASMLFKMHRLNGIDFAEIVADPSPARAVYVWSYHLSELSRRAAAAALTGFNELLPDELRWPLGDEEAGFERAYHSLESYARRRKFSANRALLIQAAENRGIPWEILVEPFTRLGQGKFQHHVRAAVTGRTSVYANWLAKDKRYSNRILADLHLPVPRQEAVTKVEDAVTAAKVVGFPLVVKPSNGHGGEGVTAGLKSPEEIPPAFERARRSASNVIIESFIEGTDHRLTVINGLYVAAAKRIPPMIVGDGTTTIKELIDELNNNPLRDGWRGRKVEADEELHRLLSGSGFSLDSVLEKGATIDLRSTANISSGGSSVDITDAVHPDNRELAIRAAKGIGLDVGGIDVMTTDISKSYKEIGGAIIEVNGRPGFRPHAWPVIGKPRDVAGAAMETMFPSGSQGRVPIALFTGRSRLDPVARTLDHILRLAGMTVGIVSDDGASINGEPVGPNDWSSRQATRSVLRDPRVEALVTAMSPRRVVKRGLLHDLCEAAAIMDARSDQDLEITRQGLGVVVRATRGKLVVGVQNKLALEAVQHIEPDRLVLVSRGAGNAAVLRHLEVGGQAVATARDSGRQVIAMLEGGAMVASIPIKSIPALAGRPFRDGLDEHLFAVALAWGMGVSGEQILSLLSSNIQVDDAVSVPTALDPKLTPGLEVTA